MARQRKTPEKFSFKQIVKDVCDENNLKYDQVNPLVIEILKRTAIGLISGKSVSMPGFGTIITTLKVINRKSWVLPCFKDGKTYEVPCVPKLNFKLSLNKQIDPTKNYQ